MKKLVQQIERARMQVHTDSYPMSIGELINLYDDGEIDIHPEFQRVYRWSDEQKSRLIESIFLGIPLPSIFVAQRQDGVWDVVDGLQRISTILSFVGKLKNENDELLDALELRGTKYIPAMEGMLWDCDNEENQVSADLKRLFKREKLDIKIIKRESEDDTKFELFQRLNTGGSKLSDQEVRNCMLLMINKNAYKWVDDCSKNTDFIACCPISEKQKEESYLHELVVRFVILRHSSEDIKSKHTDIAPYINDEVIRLMSLDNLIDYEKEERIFNRTFNILNSSLNDSSFKKYNHSKGRHEGALSLPIFEAIIPAVSNDIEAGIADESLYTEKLVENVKKLTADVDFLSVLDNRTRPIDRMSQMGQIGRRIFK